jgi:hypothetical protein
LLKITEIRVGNKQAILSASAQLAQSRKGGLLDCLSDQTVPDNVTLSDAVDPIFEDPLFKEIYEKFEKTQPTIATEEFAYSNAPIDADEQKDNDTAKSEDGSEPVEPDLMSKKKARKILRMTIPQLKSLVHRPEVVEVFHTVLFIIFIFYTYYLVDGCHSKRSTATREYKKFT